MSLCTLFMHGPQSTIFRYMFVRYNWTFQPYLSSPIISLHLYLIRSQASGQHQLWSGSNQDRIFCRIFLDLNLQLYILLKHVYSLLFSSQYITQKQRIPSGSILLLLSFSQDWANVEHVEKVPMTPQSSTKRLESRNWREGEGILEFRSFIRVPLILLKACSSWLGMPTIPKTRNRNSNSRITAKISQMGR